MDNSLIPQGIEIVQKAIAADGEGEFERALALYRDALARFTMGLKYEKNEARKKLVLERVEGYMKRAEELSDYLKKQSELDKNGGGGGGVAAAKKGEKGGGDDADAEKTKLRGALSSAIVSEKPNISWDDVAGLDNAKESLKEVSHGHAERQGKMTHRNVLSCRRLRFPFFPSPVFRRSFYPPNFRNSLLVSGSHSRAFCSTGLRGRESHTSPRPWRQKRIPPFSVSAVPT